MRIGTAQLAAVLIIGLGLNATVDAQARKKKAAAPAKLPCGDLVGFHPARSARVLERADRWNTGREFSRTLSAFQAAHKRRRQAGLRHVGSAGRRSSEPAIKLYGHRPRHEGPFEKVPPKLADQAKLTTLGYKSPMELLAERFHTSPALLSQLNRGVTIAAGREIKVPAVAAFNPETKPAADAAAGDISIQVSKEESALARRAPTQRRFYGRLERQRHDPLPPVDLGAGSGGVRFHYNPDCSGTQTCDAKRNPRRPKTGRRRLSRSA